MQDYNNEFIDELEYDDEFEFENEFEYNDEFESGGEDEELAYELLNVQGDEELEHFLGSLFKKAIAGGRRFLGSKYGRSLTNHFRQGAKRFGRRMLPQLGRSVGGYLGQRFGGSRGGQYGSQAGNNIGQWAMDRFGMELEAMAPDDQEMEVAKKLVNIVKTAAKIAANKAQAQKTHPKALAHAALNAAVKRVAAKGSTGKKPMGSRHAGRWVRRGTKIVVLGA